jgi:IstB-like ATP binding protein
MATPSLPDEPADPELRVRFTTATALVNELVEARAANILSRALGRWERIELIGIDELGYVPLAEIGAELLFQVIADRAELPVHAVGDLPPGSLARGRPAQQCLRYVGSWLSSALQSLAQHDRNRVKTGHLARFDRCRTQPGPKADGRTRRAAAR